MLAIRIACRTMGYHTSQLVAPGVEERRMALPSFSVEGTDCS